MDIAHWIAGRAETGAAHRWGEVYNPSTGAVSARVPMASQEVVTQAIAAAAKAWPAWAATPALQRARVLFRFRELLLANWG